MGKYWLKIGLGALLVFGVGFVFVSAGRHVRSTIHSNRDLTIPLGGFIPFKLDGIQVGTLRSLVIHRSSPEGITGFDVNTRITDSAVFDRLRNCHFTVTDTRHLDERTTFLCLKSDSGYQAFGEVRISLRTPTGANTLIQPLMLPEAAVRDLQRHASDSVSVAPAAADSLLNAVQERVREQRRVYNDSVSAARLESRAKDMQRQADSLRARRTPAQPPPA